MSSNKSIVTSGSTSTEVKSSSVQQKKSSSTQQTSQRSQLSKTSGSEVIEKSFQSGGNATATTTTTIYDADGNVVKTIRNVDNKYVPSVQDRSIEYITTSDDGRRGSSDRTINDNYHNSRRIPIDQDYDNRPLSPTPSQASSVAATYVVDENYVDTNKVRDKNASSDFRNFYGHGRDSSKTVVGNAYDSNAIQNTIGTRGRVVMDHNIDTTDVVFSNDRNYGKTGWNGQFIDEEPPIQKIGGGTKQKPWERPASLKTKAKLRPEDLPPAGVPTSKRY